MSVLLSGCIASVLPDAVVGHILLWRSYFDVSFPEKHLKIVATRGEILAWNSPNTVWRQGSARTLGELKRSPRPPSRNKGGLLLRGGEERRGGRGGEERVKPPPPDVMSGYAYAVYIVHLSWQATEPAGPSCVVTGDCICAGWNLCQLLLGLHAVSHITCSIMLSCAPRTNLCTEKYKTNPVDWC